MEEEKKKKEGKKFKINKNMVANAILLAGVFFAIGFFVSQVGLFDKNKKSYISLEEAQAKVKSFVSENLIQPGIEMEIKKAVEEDGLYKISISIQGQDIDTYLSKDGENFFPQAMNIKEIEAQTKAMVEGQQTAQTEVPKQAKPVVESFIMSYCPYGTQIQKGLLPVINLLKDKIDFDFKFVDYAMHDKQEIDENLVQYCINSEDQSKYYKYLECFLSENNSKSCLAKAQINETKINQCVKDVDSKYQVTEKFNNKEGWGGQFPPFDVQKEDNQKYGVKGSPTLIINGVEASSARDPQSLLQLICSSFEEAPVECNQALSAETPAPGFGSGTTDSQAAADCAE